MTASEIIEKLGLTKSPTEGGYYREVHKVVDPVSGKFCANDIYYLLTASEICGLHKVKRPTEIYSYYLGDPVEMIQVTAEGEITKTVLGPDLEKGHLPKALVLPEVWQGLRLVGRGKWVLLGITCVPGFQSDDYLGATLSKLTAEFPHLIDQIRPFIDERN